MQRKELYKKEVQISKGGGGSKKNWITYLNGSKKLKRGGQNSLFFVGRPFRITPKT